ncbi:MAG: RNA polymerase sigma factor [Defluviitaleaceae bacterium]|nr:RNA polymerase sigma factor [Defluviitaleaceae bacterium]
MNASVFEKLLEDFGTDLYSFCGYLAGGMAGDLYQDTVLAVFEMRGRIDVSQNPKALFFSVAVGKWKNIRRKAWRRAAIVPEVPLDGEMLQSVQPKAPVEDGPEGQLQSSFTREIIRDALASLDDKFRIPILLHYFDEWSLEEVAQICSVPKGTIKSRLHKGRALMKAALEKEGF